MPELEDIIASVDDETAEWLAALTPENFWLWYYREGRDYVEQA